MLAADLAADDTDDPVVGINHWQARHGVEGGDEVLQLVSCLCCQHSVRAPHQACRTIQGHTTSLSVAGGVQGLLAWCAQQRPIHHACHRVGSCLNAEASSTM